MSSTISRARVPRRIRRLEPAALAGPAKIGTDARQASPVSKATAAVLILFTVPAVRPRAIHVRMCFLTF